MNNTVQQQKTSPITADSILELDKSDHSHNSAGVEDLLHQADHLLEHGKTLNTADNSSTLHGLQISSTSVGTLNSGKSNVEPLIVEAAAAAAVQTSPPPSAAAAAAAAPMETTTTTTVHPVVVVANHPETALQGDVEDETIEEEIEVTDGAYEEEEILEEEEEVVVEVSEGVYEEEIIDTEKEEDDTAELANINEVPVAEKEAANEMAAKEAAAVPIPASPVKSSAAAAAATTPKDVLEPRSSVQISSQSLASGQMMTPPDDSKPSAVVTTRAETSEPASNLNDDDPYEASESSQSSKTVDTMDTAEELWQMAEAAEEEEAIEQQAKQPALVDPLKSSAVESASISSPKRSDGYVSSSSLPHSPMAISGQSLASGMMDEAGEQVVEVKASEHNDNDDEDMLFDSSEHHQEQASHQAAASPSTAPRTTLAPPEGAPSPIKFSKEKVTVPVVVASTSNNKKRDINAKTSEEVKSPRRAQRNRVAAAGAVGAGLTAGAVTKFANKGDKATPPPPKVIRTPHYIDDPTDEVTMDRLAENAVAVEAPHFGMSAVPEEPAAAAANGAANENNEASSDHTTGDEEAYAGPVDLDDLEEEQYSTASDDSQSSATVETNESGEEELWKRAEAEDSDNEQENERDDSQNKEESNAPMMTAAAMGAAAGVGAGLPAASQQPGYDADMSPESDMHVQQAIPVQSAPSASDEMPREPEIASRALPFADQDVESGESPKDDEDLTKEMEEEDCAETRKGVFTPLVLCQLCVICLVIIAIAVLIPLLLLKKDDDRSVRRHFAWVHLVDSNKQNLHRLSSFICFRLTYVMILCDTNRPMEHFLESPSRALDTVHRMMMVFWLLVLRKGTMFLPMLSTMLEI